MLVFLNVLLILIIINKIVYAFLLVVMENLQTQHQEQDLVAQDVQHHFMPSLSQRDVFQFVNQDISEEMEQELVQRLVFQDNMQIIALVFVNLAVNLRFSLIL